MSDQQMMAPGPPAPAPPAPLDAPTLDQVLGSLLHATDSAARQSASADDVREVREYGAAALSFAQAYAVLHPQIIAPQGVTPDVLAASMPTPPPAADGNGQS